MPLVLRASIVAAGMCALLAQSACGPANRTDNTVVFASGTDLESGNPLVTIHSLSRQVQRFALFTTLTSYDSALAPVPYAARSWEWSADRRTLTLHLAADLHWHDGPLTTARDVAFTLLAARDVRTGFPRAADLAALDTVLARDDSTADLRFRTAQPRFPLVLCELPLLPEHLLRDIPRTAMRQASFSFAPVGNGPFRFAERVPGQRWRFVRNETFPATLGGPPHIAQLVIAVVDEPTTKFAGLASGDLDFAGIAPGMAALAKRDPSLRVLDYPVLLANGLIFNTHRAPFDDVRVRRAINLSLDRDRIVRAALAGFGTAASGPVVPESPLALPAAPPHDVRSADSLLNAAGWARPGNGATTGVRTRNGRALRVELWTVGSGDNAIEQLVQSDLAARGVQMDIRQLELGTFLARARAPVKEFDLLITGVPGDVSLAYLGALYDSRQAGGALDYADFHTAALDSLFARTRAAATPEQLGFTWRAVQTELAREQPAAWIYHARGLQGTSRRVTNVRIDLRGELASLAQWSLVVPER